MGILTSTTDPTMARTSPFSLQLMSGLRFSLLRHGLLPDGLTPQEEHDLVAALLQEVVSGLDYCLAMEQRLGTRRRFTNHDEVRAWLTAQFEGLFQVDNEALIEQVSQNSEDYHW